MKKIIDRIEDVYVVGSKDYFNNYLLHYKPDENIDKRDYMALDVHINLSTKSALEVEICFPKDDGECLYNRAVNYSLIERIRKEFPSVKYIDTKTYYDNMHDEFVLEMTFNF